MPLRCAHCLSNAVTKLSPGLFECLHCGATGERIPRPAYVPRKDPQGRDGTRPVASGPGTRRREA